MRARNCQKLSSMNMVKRVFRRLFGELFGEPCLRVLELRLKQRFSEDPYKILCDDPGRFCKGLREVFGEGFDMFFKASAEKLIEKYSLKNLEKNEFAGVVKDDEKAGRKLLDLLIESARKKAERIASGSLLLSYQDKDGVISIIELAKINGKIEEEFFGDLGWAVKMAGVIVFGIEFGDEKIPIAIYSKRYARFREIAERWINETSRLLRLAKSV